VATFLERVWKRHSNPWSVWTRILSYPLVYVPVWNRSWKQGAAVAAWFAANPVLFLEPKGDDLHITSEEFDEVGAEIGRALDYSMCPSRKSRKFWAR
jgi:hypothetical protein